MAGTHYIFKKNLKTGEYHILNIVSTIHEARAVKDHLINKNPRWNTSAIFIMEHVG